MPGWIDSQTVEGQLTVNSLATGTTTQATAASTLSLTLNSATVQYLTGSTTGQIVKLPDATTILAGQRYEIYNTSSVAIQIQDGGGNTLFYLAAQQYTRCVLQVAGSAAGTWATSQKDLMVEQNIASYLNVFDDFISPVNGTNAGSVNWTIQKGGTGTAVTTPTALLDSAHPGIIKLATGSTATGVITVNLAPLRLGSGNLTFETMVNIPALGVTATQFIIQIGFGAGASINAASDPASGVWFEYSNGAAGDFWRARAGNASTYTSVTTTQGITAGSWYKLKIVVNPAANQALFYASAAGGGALTLVATITTNIPPNSVDLDPFQQIRNTTATVSNFYIDYVSMQYVFTTQR